MMIKTAIVHLKFLNNRSNDWLNLRHLECVAIPVVIKFGISSFMHINTWLKWNGTLNDCLPSHPRFNYFNYIMTGNALLMYLEIQNRKFWLLVSKKLVKIFETLLDYTKIMWIALSSLYSLRIIKNNGWEPYKFT